MAFNGDSDQALLERIGKGDDRAMRLLYERYQGAVASFAASRQGGDRARAADVLHDVMLHVWQKPGSFAGRSSFKTWLLTLARNKAIDRIRKEARLDYGDEGDKLVDEQPTADVKLEALQNAERLRACVNGLPPAQRTAISLTFFEGLSINEASEVEGVPPGTIKTRIFHAKKRLAHCLGGEAS